MFTPEEVRTVFPEGTFGPPVTPEDMVEAERLLGHELPEQLRVLYMVFNGFQGPTNAPFFFPLLKQPGGRGESLVSYTRFFRSEGYFPEWVQHAIALGDNGTGVAWFMLVNEGNRLVRWDAEWDDYQTVDGSLLDAWSTEKKLYES